MGKNIQTMKDKQKEEESMTITARTAKMMLLISGALFLIAVGMVIHALTQSLAFATTMPDSLSIESSDDAGITIKRGDTIIAYMGDVGAGGSNSGEVLLYNFGWRTQNPPLRCRRHLL